jgi:hypothetical protein
MVRANGANTNTEIRALFSHRFFTPIRHPKNRRSMHPSRPREADWVARWPGDQRGARGSRRRRAGEGRASPGSCAHPHTEMHAHGHGDGPTRPAPTGEFRPGADAGEPDRRR